MKLAIISDLHIGDAVRAKELCPYANDSTFDEGFLEALQRLISEKDLKCDYLVVPGDLTNGAHPVECKLAGEVIQKIGGFLGVSAENVVVVPGNHDVSWVIPKALTEALMDPRRVVTDTTILEGFARDKRYLSFSWTASSFDSFLGGAWRNLLIEPYFVFLERPNIIVAAYNSAFNDGPDKKPHNGEAHPDHLEMIAEKLRTLKPKKADPRPRLFVVHHHVHQHTGPNYKWVDFSIMHNADGLQNLLREFEFDLLVHGHKHFPRFATHSVSGNPPLAILGAGSFSRSLDKQEIEMLGNTFHIIDVHGRNANEALQGEVLTWVYQQTHGWIPAEKKRYAIAHLHPFGCDWTNQTLEQRLEAEIESALVGNNFVKVSTIIRSKLPDLRFADSERLERAIDSVAHKLSLEVVRSKEDPRNWMVLKGIVP